MCNWPTPKMVKQLQAFLNLTEYYRRFICQYATIAAPLTKLLKKNGFRWTEEVENTFVKLKYAMTTTSVLRLTDFTLPFVIESDAFDV